MDLDNTIYHELSYLNEVYNSVLNELTYTEKSKELYNIYGNNQIYTRLSKIYKELDAQYLIQKHREISVAFKPSYLDWAKFVFNCLEETVPIRIITNGNPLQQKNKIKQLKLLDKFITKEIIYANETKPKPDPKSFESLTTIDKSKECIYIGDSVVDKMYAHNLNIEYIDVSCISI